MRSNIKMLCVTNWGTVLELITEPVARTPYSNKLWLKSILTVADPNAIDAGQEIRVNDIKLVARIKYKK